MANHDIILGIPWLKQHNPIINWMEGVLRFRNAKSVTSIYPKHQQRSMLNKKSNLTVEACEALSLNKDGLIKGSASAVTVKGQ